MERKFIAESELKDEDDDFGGGNGINSNQRKASQNANTKCEYVWREKFEI